MLVPPVVPVGKCLVSMDTRSCFFYFCLPSVSIMAFVVGKDFAFSICSNIILHTSQLHGNNWIMMIKVGETPMSCRP